jgi:branched-subunit amino acid ABC-type transport system permease component
MNLAAIVIGGVTAGCSYALLAVSFNLIHAVSRVISFAIPALFPAAGFIYFAFTTDAEADSVAFVPVPYPTLLLGLPAPAGLALSAATVAGLSSFVWLIAIRPLGNIDTSRDVRWILTTAGLGLVIIQLTQTLFGTSSRRVPELFTSFFGWTGSSPSGYVVTPNDATLVITTVVLGTGLMWWETSTKTGTAVSAVAQDSGAAGLIGINSNRYAVALWTVSGAVVALTAAVALPARQQGTVDSGPMQLLAVFALIAAIVGGLGSLRGAFAGGLLVGLAQALVTEWFDPGRANLAAFALLFAVLVVRSRGLFGLATSERV